MISLEKFVLILSKKEATSRRYRLSSFCHFDWKYTYSYCHEKRSRNTRRWNTWRSLWVSLILTSPDKRATLQLLPSHARQKRRILPWRYCFQSKRPPSILIINYSPCPEVENQLFKVHRHLFTELSPVFRDMFKLPVPQGAVADGLSDNQPLVLDGIEKKDFVQLLRCIYPR